MYHFSVAAGHGNIYYIPANVIVVPTHRVIDFNRLDELDFADVPYIKKNIGTMGKITTFPWGFNAYISIPEAQYMLVPFFRKTEIGETGFFTSILDLRTLLSCDFEIVRRLCAQR